jgi:hypothetical protein
LAILAVPRHLGEFRAGVLVRFWAAAALPGWEARAGTNEAEKVKKWLGAGGAGGAGTGAGAGGGVRTAFLAHRRRRPTPVRGRAAPRCGVEPLRATLPRRGCRELRTEKVIKCQEQALNAATEARLRT